MKEIQALFDTYRTAVYAKDLESFTSIFDDNVQIFDMWEWAYEGLDDWRKMAKGWFGSLGEEKVAVTFQDIRIEAAGDLGFATAYVRFAAISPAGEELRFLQNRLTWVARKTADGYKIMHEHTSGPVDGGTMKVRLQR